jgi:hypothetical protein
MGMIIAAGATTWPASRRLDGTVMKINPSHIYIYICLIRSSFGYLKYILL